MFGLLLWSEVTVVLPPADLLRAHCLIPSMESVLGVFPNFICLVSCYTLLSCCFVIGRWPLVGLDFSSQIIHDLFQIRFFGMLIVHPLHKSDLCCVVPCYSAELLGCGPFLSSLAGSYGGFPVVSSDVLAGGWSAG